MKQILKEYCRIIGNVLVGITFGFAFFYLFLNFYHYQELRREVKINVKNDALVVSIDESLIRTMNNINTFTGVGYQGSLDYSNAYALNAKLKDCVTKFQNSEYLEIKNKTTLNIRDVYELRNSFESEVLNSCVALHIYPLIAESNDSYFTENRDLIKNYADTLLSGTSYLKDDLYDTSNYYFTTDNYSAVISNKVRNSFYETLSAYSDTAKFLEEISEWYASRVGGNVND